MQEQRVGGGSDGPDRGVNLGHFAIKKARFRLGLLALVKRTVILNRERKLAR
jgi:hypothetical protein